MLYFLPTFKWIIYSTILGSILSFVIFIFKLLFKNKLNARWHYCVWLLLIIKLLVPYSPKSTLSIFNILNLCKINVTEINSTLTHNTINSELKVSTQKPISIKPKNKIYSNQNKPITTANTHTEEFKSNTPSTVSFNNLSLYFKITYMLWLFGVLALTIFTITATLKFYLKLKKQQICVDKDIIKILATCKNKMGVHKEVMILNTSLVSSPAIFGCIHPKLLLPLEINKQLNHKELEYVIYHETAHLKRKDILVSCITCILQILHWFNPIIWYSFYNMRHDKELACDSLALSYIYPDEYVYYGKTIIKLLEYYQHSNHVCGMACIINNKSIIKRRITMISLFKKGSYKWSPIPIFILAMMSLALLTNGKNAQVLASNKNPKSSKIEQNLNNKDSSISEYDIEGNHFKGKMLVIPKSKKISVGFNNEVSKITKTTSEIAKDNNALCAINAGGFTESILPYGLIIHNGNVVYNDIKDKESETDIVAFNETGKLIVGRHSLSQLKKMNIKEAVSFGPALVINGQPMIAKDNGNWGTAPRTAIGQRADGTTLFLTIDGRSNLSLGATLSEVQNILIEFGAVTASNLDGGSSSTMYYNGNIINHPFDLKGHKVERITSSTFMVLH
ncbi:M56 family metallopeptidase [Clostridium brassicae]|uniref:Phosphodiester glycosidase family protein n=1 Tax=Clostridium brassicae TaxID=2999072 RepID=A0ABT4DD18_9CLOT|nr:M56 family metallopeptidase [Clostridium brassicae]MCY6960205.1 phosphodiester glycosidase family protein [Clostridium brassicae]